MRCWNLEDLVSLYFNNSTSFQLPKGVLLYGPPGVGKTRLVMQLGKKGGGVISAQHIASPTPGETEAALEAAFEQCVKESKLLFLDELDVLVPQGGGIQAQRIGVKLAKLMESKSVLVLAATNRPQAVEPSLRRPGRFEVEVEIGPPRQSERAQLLAQMSCPSHLTNKVAEYTNGFVAADLVALVRAAFMNAISTSTSRERGGEVGWEDFEVALKSIPPSLKREFHLKLVEPVKWSDIGGLEETKKRLTQAVIWPLLYPETFQRLGLRPARGILLYGPPGCSKTTLAKAVAHETKASFFTAQGASVYSAFVGESERFIRDLFSKARAASPSVIFLDEMEALVGKRSGDAEGGSGGGGGGVGGGRGDVVQERILATLLNEMDGITMVDNQQVLILGATNRLDRLDEALLRPGRFDCKIYVPPPDEVARKKILEIYLEKMNGGGEVINYLDSLVVEQTEGCSGADLKHLCNEAGMRALRRSLLANSQVTVEDFKQALKGCH